MDQKVEIDTNYSGVCVLYRVQGISRSNEKIPCDSGSRHSIGGELVMELSNYLPDGSRLGPSSFKVWDASRKEKRLTLSVNHFVGSRFESGTTEGHAAISYVLQVPDVAPEVSKYLNVTRSACPIGYQSPDLVRSLTEVYRPRMSYALAEVGDGIFDMRSLAYVLGMAVVCGSSDTPYSYSHGICGVRQLAPTWTIPVTGEVTLGPGVIQDRREYITLAKLAKSAGCNVIQIISESLPPSDARPLQGTQLCTFALRTVSALLLSAQACGCADHHLQAFFRGMNAVMSLWAHTDEGGWVRKALRRADYPSCSGVLASTGESIIGIPARINIAPSEVTRVTVSLFLTMAGAVPVADAYDSGRPTVFTRQGIARPSSFRCLDTRMYDVARKWRSVMSERFDLFESSVIDGHSFETFFRDNAVDPHLEGEHVIPFWWVEPGPLHIGGSGKLFMPMALGKRVELPLMDCDRVKVPAVMEDYRGCLPGGAAVRLRRGGGDLRSQGYSYLLSPTYRTENGLSMMYYVTAPRDGVVTHEALFTNPAETNAAQRRWVTPHNPAPNPCEGYTDLPSMIQYTYTGFGKEPGLRDWTSGRVFSSLGFFSVGPTVPMLEKNVHRFVPEELLPLVDRAHRMNGWANLNGSTTEFIDYDLVAPPPAPTPEPVVEEEVTPRILTPQLHTAPTVDDPRQVVLGDPEVGERQNLASQNREDAKTSDQDPPEAPSESS